MASEELNPKEKDVLKGLFEDIHDGIFNDTIELLEPYRADPKVLKKIVNGKNDAGDTLLLALTKQSREKVGDRLGYGELLERLIYYGANVNAKDKSNNTALYYARENGHNGMVNMLLDNRAIQGGKKSKKSKKRKSRKSRKNKRKTIRKRRK